MSGQFIANWNYPTTIRFGVGRINDLAKEVGKLGMSRPLLVTDKGLVALPVYARVKKILDDNGIQYEEFSDIKPNPTGSNVDEGVRCLRQSSCDGVIAFGGGSAMDAAKAIALMAGQTRALWDFEDVGDNWTRVIENGMVPCIAIPTTAGTGSEVGRASVITEESQHRKVIIFHPRMLPPVVIADPELTCALPAAITAATGMDALSHNLEALCSPGFHPMAEGIAIEGIRLIKEYLPAAYKDGNDMTARANMLVASSMGATAFQKGLGAMHALAHPLGANYDAHHGMLNAIVMPYVLEANAKAIQDKMARLAACLDLPGRDTKAVIDWVLSLRKTLGIPHTLAAIGIDDSKASYIAQEAEKDPSAGGNPISFSVNEYETLLRKAING
ncbi:MAG: iron-containing alcohol dehydrogenase [Gammaproteobacteria bacterium]|nr:iron-containing alcohol dehydrogenase [Gammaproteobacteria bacterium]